MLLCYICRTFIYIFIFYFVDHKSKFEDKFELFLNTVKNQTSISLKTLRCDCGFKDKNAEIKVILDKFGIKYETSVPYTSQ